MNVRRAAKQDMKKVCTLNFDIPPCRRVEVKMKLYVESTEAKQRGVFLPGGGAKRRMGEKVNYGVRNYVDYYEVKTSSIRKNKK